MVKVLDVAEVIQSLLEICLWVRGCVVRSLYTFAYAELVFLDEPTIVWMWFLNIT
jgi:hypothetical protein